MVPERALDLRGSRTRVPSGTCRVLASVDGFDLVLEVSWANECVALVVQAVSRHRGRLP